MKNIQFIKDPLLKLLYIDCFLYAKEHNGVVSQSFLYALIQDYLLKGYTLSNFNPYHFFSIYQKIEENAKKLLCFNENNIVNRTKKDINNDLKILKELKKEQENIIEEIINASIFIKKLNKDKIKKYKLEKEQITVDDYFFLDAYEEIQKEQIFLLFNEQGLDPVLFLNTALNNIKKNSKYKFLNLLDLFNLTQDKTKEINIQKNKQEQFNEIIDEQLINNENLLININNFDLIYNDQISNLLKLTAFNTEKIFDIKKIKDSLEIIEEAEIKGFWVQLGQYLQAEGKTLKEANSQIAKLRKEENIKDIIEALNDIKKRKSTPPSMIAAIKFYIANKEKDNQKNSLFVM